METYWKLIGKGLETKMPTRRELLRGLIIGGAGGAAILGTPSQAGATIADQRRWTGIVRSWSPGNACALDQINSALVDEFPEEWKQPYRGFVYGFRGVFPAQDTLGVCGQWVAARWEKDQYLYASVPGDFVGQYAPGDNFVIPRHFRRETLRTPEGFAELWTAVRDSQVRILRAVDQLLET